MMKKWQEQFDKHPIHNTIKLFEDEASKEVENIDSIDSIERARFLKVVILIKQVLKNIDPDLAPFDILNNIQDQFQRQGLINTINSYKQTNNTKIFENANNQINPCLSYVYQISSLKFARSSRKADIDAATTVFSQFATKSEKSFTDFVTQYTDKVSAISDAEHTINEIKDNSENILSSANEKIDDWEDRVNKLSILMKERFDEDNKSRHDEYEKLIKNKEENLDEITNDLHEKYDNIIDDIKRSFETKISTIEKNSKIKHEKIIELYKLVALDSITGGYKNTASREYIAATRWRWAATGFVLLALSWLLFSFFYPSPENLPEREYWLRIFKSALISGLLLSFAVYASKQSLLHRINEKQYNSFFLQVQAFDPFIADLPDVEKNALKTGLTKQIFGKEEHSATMDLYDKTTFKGVDKIVDILERMAKIKS